MQIQERDRKILELLYDHGFLLAEHVERYFSDARNAARRIRKLIQAGYIFETESPAIKGTSALRLARLGRIEIERTLAYRIPGPRPLQPTKLFHDAQVITTHQRLEELWNGRWIPEALLAKDQDVPDGIFIFPSGKRIFIEVENSHKAQARFLRRLRGFSGQILVLYVATLPPVERSITRALSNEKDPLPPVALISLSNLLSPAPAVWSPGRNLSLFHVMEF